MVGWLGDCLVGGWVGGLVGWLVLSRLLRVSLFFELKKSEMQSHAYFCLSICVFCLGNTALYTLPHPTFPVIS